MKKILLSILVFYSGLASGQTVINDFESDSPATIFRYNADGETSFSIVANPNSTGNTSDNVGRFARTSGNWFELMGFDLATPYTVAAGETQYLHVYVNYPAEPDVSVRMDAADASSDGSADVRALNTYTDFGQWQDLVFQLDGGDTGATVNSIIMLPDIGFENDPAGFVLNNIDAFAYIDNFRFTDSATPDVLNTLNYKLDNFVTISPNPTQSVFKVETKESINVSDVSIYNILGERVTQNMLRLNTNEYDISKLTSGVYFVIVTDDNNNSISKKLIKE